jgi:endonuclease I/chitodextrinase
MKKLLLLLLFITSLSFGQQAYYNDVDLTANGLQLRDNLATKIINTHTNFLSYTEVWEALKITDLDPTDATNSKVLLIYGSSDTDGNYVTDRTRSKTANGGTAGTDWNREHTYAKSLGTPNLGTSGPGSDAHHLRAADVTLNGNRSSKKFAAGSGVAGDSNGGWYPGDEWKGDIARMMMYMYLRYGNQCLPSGVAIGTTNTVDANMIDLLLQWNAEDPVSQVEDNRNTYLSDATNTYGQGNRNPFIDNPYLATRIWGGPTAEDRWNTTPDTQAPSAPTNLTASNITNTTADLTWTASTDDIAVTAYDIYKDGVLLASSSTNSYNVTGLTQNTTYNFTVYAKDAAGNTSNVSNTATFTTTNIIDTTAPSTITDLSASNTTSTSTDLSWTAATDNVGVTSYDIYKDGVLLASSTTNSYNVTGLTASTSYSFTVYAKDAAGNTSNVSNTATVTTSIATSTCGTETFTNTGTAASSYITYNWTGDNGVNWTSTDSRNDQLIASSRTITIRNGSLTSSTVSGGISELTVTTQRVFSGGSGTFNVDINGTIVGTIPYDATVQTTTLTGFNISGNVVIKLTGKASTSDRVAIDNLTWNCYNSTLSTQQYVSGLFNVYPNPSTNNTLTISVKNNTALKGVQLYNTLGQLIISVKNPKTVQNKIQLKNIPSGIYILKVFNSKEYSSRRIIIQ